MNSSPQRKIKKDESPYTPILPAEEQSEQQGHSYRLQQISLPKRHLEDEREKRAALYRNTIVELTL